MLATDERVIALSQSKLMALVLGALVFVGIGLYMVSADDSIIQARRRFNDPLFVHAIGWVSMVFFGVCGMFALKKLFDKKPGLIFSHAGITDNSSGVAAGLIPWSEIDGFNIYEVSKQKMLVVLLKDPEKYIENGHAVKRSLNRINYKMCGSPITISANSLKINFVELLDITQDYYKKYGNLG